MLLARPAAWIRGWSVVVAAACVLPGAGAEADLAVNVYQAARHERFYQGPDRAFIAEPFDLSAIAYTTPHGTGAWGTMIDDQYFLAAKHAYPRWDILTFFETSNQDGPRHIYPTSSAWVGHWGDLWLGRLQAPIPASHHITPMPIADDWVTGARDTYVVGRGTQFRPGYAGHRVALNRGTISGALLSLNPKPLAPFTAEANPDGATTVPGDSGAPSFVVQNGAPALAGIHYVSNGDSYVPLHRQAILDAVAADRAAQAQARNYTHTRTLPTDLPAGFDKTRSSYLYLQAERDHGLKLRPEDAGHAVPRSGTAESVGVQVNELDGSGDTFSMHSMALAEGGVTELFWNKLLTTSDFTRGLYQVYAYAAQEPGRGATQNYRLHLNSNATANAAELPARLDRRVEVSATPSWVNLGEVVVRDGVNTFRLASESGEVAPYFDTLLLAYKGAQPVTQPLVRYTFDGAAAGANSGSVGAAGDAQVVAGHAQVVDVGAVAMGGGGDTHEAGRVLQQVRQSPTQKVPLLRAGQDIDAIDGAAITAAGGLTVSFFANFDSKGSWVVVLKDDAFEISQYSNSNALRLMTYRADGTPFALNSMGVIVPDEWHLYTLAIPVGQHPVWYRDGQLIGYASGAGFSTAGVHDGAGLLQVVGSTGALQGSMVDDVRIFSGLLNDAEVGDLWRASVPEPGTMLLLPGAAAGWVWRRGRPTGDVRAAGRR